MEKQLECLLLEHETLSEAQQAVECPVKRVAIGEQIETVLQDIAVVNATISVAPAHDLSDAAVLLRRVDATLYGCSGDKRGRASRMLGAALAAVEAHTS